MIYYFLCILAVVLASFVGGPVSYSVLFGLLLVTPVSFAYLLVVYLFFKIYQVVQSKHIGAYEPVGYYFVLQNEYLLNFCHIRTTMYSTFSYIEKMPENMEYELLPHESARYDTRLICRYRGEYRVGIKEITITDFLRLFSITYRVPEPVTAFVSPRIVKIAHLRIPVDPQQNSYKEKYNLKHDFDASVRDYVPGDPFKGIHQKMSAKTGRLMSRLMTGEERQGISIFLDTDRISDNEYEYIPVENKCLEIVLAIANYYAAADIPSKLKFYRSGKPQKLSERAENAGTAGSLEECGCMGAHDMEGFLAKVSRISFRNDERSGHAVYMIASDPVFLNSMVAFLVITGTSREFNETISRLSQSGVPCVIYYVGYDTDAGKIIKLPDQLVVTVHPEDELEKVL